MGERVDETRLAAILSVVDDGFYSITNKTVRELALDLIDARTEIGNLREESAERLCSCKAMDAEVARLYGLAEVDKAHIARLRDVIDELAPLRGPVPTHECEFAMNPEKGECWFHSAWAELGVSDA